MLHFIDNAPCLRRSSRDGLLGEPETQENQSHRGSTASNSDAKDEGVNNAPPDESIHISEEVGHEGHMVANVYTQSKQDSKALIRMGIFAGIALAFHVRKPLPSYENCWLLR